MKFIKRIFVLSLTIMLILTGIPCQTQAAASPKFKLTRSVLYENSKDFGGVYTYTLKNVSKGQIVKWSLSGSGKSYARLRFSTKKVTGSTISNQITIRTNGDTAAMNKTVKLTAKVYKKNGKYWKKVSTSAQLKVLSTGITITGGSTDNTYLTGSSYSFATTLTPVNSTDSVKWTVTDSSNADVSSYMSSTGVFTPAKAGTYKITASSYAGTAFRASAYRTVQVKDSVSGITQTSLNAFKVQVAPSIASTLTAASFKISGSNGTTVTAKSISTSADGTVTVTVYNNFSNGITYTVVFGNYTRTFTASSGIPMYLELLTTQVTVNKPTKIKYALRDRNGIDVTVYYPGTLSFSSTLTSGVNITTDYKLTMSTIGAATTLTVTFLPLDNYIGQIVGSGTVVCVANETSANTNFTITGSASEPNYKVASYSDNRKTTAGATTYAHFRALDKDGDPIAFSSLTYESSDPDTLIITPSGKITAIKNGVVTVSVRAVVGGFEQYYPYTVTVTDAAYLTNVTLDTPSLTMSNVYSSNYVKYINVSATDQFGDYFSLDNETVVISGTTSIGSPKITYNKANNQIQVTTSGAYAGDYSYVASITCGSHTVTTTFFVKVLNVAITGSTSYVLELDNKTFDLALNKDTVVGDKYNNLKLAKYTDGTFSGYTTFTVNSIAKDGRFYNSNLTAASQLTAPSITNISQLSMLVSSMQWKSNGTYTCKTAETGTYTIEVSYYRPDTASTAYDAISFTLTDSSKVPTATVVQDTSNATCSTALQLAQNCITVDYGTISECSVTGTSVAGSAYKIESNTQYHINTITVDTSTQISSGAYVIKQYPITISKTLKNK